MDILNILDTVDDYATTIDTDTDTGYWDVVSTFTNIDTEFFSVSVIAKY